MEIEIKWLNKTNLIKICQSPFARHRLFILNPLCYPETLSNKKSLILLLIFQFMTVRIKIDFLLDNKYEHGKKKG